MNIKTVVTNPILPVEAKKRIDGNSRSQATTDRDANGRQDGAQQELKRHLTQQEFDDAIKILEETPGLKTNSLIIQIETKDDCRVVNITDASGNIIRRLSESQLWTATRDKNKQTGKILDKAM